MGPSMPRCLGGAVIEARPDEHPMECGAWIWEGAGAWVCFVDDRFGTSSLIRGGTGVPVTPTEPPAPCHPCGHVWHGDAVLLCPSQLTHGHMPLGFCLTPPDHRSTEADVHTTDPRPLRRSMRRWVYSANTDMVSLG